MKWFEGNIADAVTASKSSNAIFVVYVEGNDDMSRAMTLALESNSITNELSSNKFVCIKLSKDSESHRQFTEIYKIVPVPSLFFIGENGVPLEIVAGDNTMEIVAKKISTSISKIMGEGVAKVCSVSSNPSPETVGPSPACLNVSQASSVPASPLVATAPPEDVVMSSAPEEANQADQMDRVQQLIKKNREQQDKQEQEKEREREMARRKMGKEITQARKTQQERDLEEMRRERERDRKMEAEARQRVLRQIEEDKAERAARNQPVVANTPSPSTDSNSTPKPSSNVSHGDEARIQFKLPDGQTRTQSFPSSSTLRDIRSFIDDNIDIPFKEYTLATTFPRREFVSRDLNRSLIDLELIPSSVLLILPIQGNLSVTRGPGWTSMISAMIWALIQPVIDIGSYLRSFITGERGTNTEPTSENVEPSQEASTTSSQEEEAVQSSRQPYYNSLGKGKSVKKRGNVHTLSDGNDSNDENNTWNGNSTQLM